MDNRPGCFALISWIGYMAVAFVTLSFMAVLYFILDGVAAISIWFQVNMGFAVWVSSLLGIVIWILMAIVLFRQSAMLLELLGRFYLMVEVRIAKVYGWLLDRIG